MCRQLSSRPRYSIFWEAGHDTCKPSLHHKLHPQSHLHDKWGCSILPPRKDLRIENFIEDVLVVMMVIMVYMVEVDMVKVDLAVVSVVEVDIVGFDVVVIDVVKVVDEDYLMNDPFYFGTYHRLDLDRRS